MGFVGLLISIGGPSQAGAAKSPLLRYQPGPATNAYSVTIEIRGASGKETLAGNLVVFRRPIGSNLIAISLRGMLNPQRDVSSDLYLGAVQPRWMLPILLTDRSEIVIDPSGRMLRTSGDFPLPVPLGSLAQLLVPRLPGKAEAKWEFFEELPVLDEPLGLGPARGLGSMQNSYTMMSGVGMPGMRNNLSAVLVVSQTTKAELKDTSATTATIQQRQVLDSPLLLGLEPRTSAKLEGYWKFDVVGGFVSRVDSEFQALLNSESSTRRGRGSLKIQTLEGKDRDAALAAQNPRQTIDPATKQVVSIQLTGEALQQVFADLQSNDDTKRIDAAMRLTSSEVVDPPQALIDYLTNYLFDAESALGSLRSAAAKMVADFGTTANVPDLLRLLKSDCAWSAIRGLERLKDPRAIGPLVECVAAGNFEAQPAASALESFGPAAEDQVLTLLNERHTRTKLTACNILQKIGTKKGIEPLRELLLHSDHWLRKAASEAVQAIQARL
jgi:HEAT repeat protein